MARSEPVALPTDPTLWSARQLASALRRRQIASTEIVQACLARIDQANPRVNAVVQRCAERAMAEAVRADHAAARGEFLGPLHGIPITIKDSLDTAELVSAAGTAGRMGHVPERDACVVGRLRRAGAIVLGKTNTPELTIGVETDNDVYGRTSNPHDPSRTSGGSSGGSAAVVSFGGSFLDIGSDTAGSLRWPAHCCGVAGLKPTAGRVPRTGHILPPGLGAIDVLTQLGPLARRVEDLALALDIMQGPDGIDASVLPFTPSFSDVVDLDGLRVIAFADNGSGTASAEVVRTVTRVAERLADAGASVSWSLPPQLQRAHELSRALRNADGRAWLRRLLKVSGTETPSAFTQRSIARTNAIDGAEFARLLENVDEIRAGLLAAVAGRTVVLSPVAGCAALPHGEWTARMSTGLLDYTQAHNLLGWPAGTVAAGWSAEGLPMGVQVAAAPWRDSLVLGVMHRIEEWFGGWVAPTACLPAPPKASSRPVRA